MKDEWMKEWVNNEWINDEEMMKTCDNMTPFYQMGVSAPREAFLSIINLKH